MKLRKRFKNWLLKEELETINDQQLQLEIIGKAFNRVLNDTISLEKSFEVFENDIGNLKYSLDNAVKRHYDATRDLKEAKESYDGARKLITKMVDVGIDVNPMESDRNPSWAVVCIDGNRQFTEFVRLGRNEARDVLSFLKSFKGSNRKIADIPPFWDGAFRDIGW